jgi:hypothetical protein
MAEFLFGVGAATLAILAYLAGRGPRHPPTYPDSAQPGREVLVEQLADDLAEIEAALESERPEAALADLINEALK